MKIYILLFFLSTTLNSVTVMLNPAGDAINPGRGLDTGYERGVTLQIAEALQKAIADRFDVKCFLTRSPGERVSDLQRASFSNRVKADFYLSIHVYREEAIKPKMSLFHLMYNTMVASAKHNFRDIELLPIDKVHLKNSTHTSSIVDKMKNILTSYKKKIDFCGSYGIPFKPLSGVVAPAVALEIGLNKEGTWKSLIDPIVESLRFLLSI